MVGASAGVGGGVSTEPGAEVRLGFFEGDSGVSKSTIDGRSAASTSAAPATSFISEDSHPGAGASGTVPASLKAFDTSVRVQGRMVTLA